MSAEWVLDIYLLSEYTFHFTILVSRNFYVTLFYEVLNITQILCIEDSYFYLIESLK